MAIQWLESFDIYGSNSDLDKGSYSVAYQFGFSNVNVRTGQFAGAVVSNGGYIVKDVAPSPVKVAGMAIYMADNGVINGSMSILDGWSTGWPVVHDFGNNAGCYGFKFSSAGNGGILIQKIENGTRLNYYWSANGLIPYNTYTYIEMVANSTDNTLQIWRNGNELLFELSGLTNMPANYSQVSWGQSLDTPSNQKWDDLYVTTGERLGAQRCYSIFPNADNAPQEWTLSGGANAYELINDRAYNPANFITGNAPGDISAFGFENFPAPNAAIHGMRINSVQSLDGAGSAISQIQTQLGATVYSGANFSPLSTPGYHDDVFDVSGKSVSDINNMITEIERIA